MELTRRIQRLITAPYVKTGIILGLLFIGGFAISAFIDQLGLAQLALRPKDTLGCVTAALSITGLGYYLIETIWGVNRPHLFSWMAWTVVDTVVWYDQWTHHAGPGAWSTLVMTILTLVITIVAIDQYRRKVGDYRITKADYWYLAGAAASFALVVIFQFGLFPGLTSGLTKVLPFFQPGLFSVLAATATEIFAYGSTLKKIGQDPGSETPVTYALNTVRHLIVLFAIESYSIVTLAFPLPLFILNGVTVAAIWRARRRQLA